MTEIPANTSALVRDAVREHNSAIVVLPEAYNTPNVYHSCLRRTPVAIDGCTS